MMAPTPRRAGRPRRPRPPLPDLGDTGVWITSGICRGERNDYDQESVWRFNIPAGMVEWLDEQFGPVGYSFIAAPDWRMCQPGIRFLTAADAVLFKLRWGA